MEVSLAILLLAALFHASAQDTSAGSGTLKYSCDFEEDLCGITTKSDGAAFVSRVRRKSYFSDAAHVPERENEEGLMNLLSRHEMCNPRYFTSGEYFLYTKLYTFGDSAKKPQFSTPTIPAETRAIHCLRFWVYLKADYLRTIDVRIRIRIQDGETLDSLVGEDEPSWTLKNINFSTETNFTVNFEMQIEAFINDSRAAMAIDDLEVFAGECPGSVTTTTVVPETLATTVEETSMYPTTTTNADSVRPTSFTTVADSTTDSTAPAPFVEVKCDFEQADLCQFKNSFDKNDVNQTCSWLPRRGPSVSSSSGPQLDHTLNSTKGVYLYLQSELCFKDQNAFAATLVTKKAIDGFRETEQCLQFWYHMAGQTKELSVFTRYAGRPKSLEFFRKGHQGKKWLKEETTIHNAAKSAFHLEFRGLGGITAAGDIALDDVSVQDGPCSMPARSADSRAVLKSKVHH